ncbi:hypothetical protein DID88_010087 [Monilinia fructigena]|uniref:Uncharacterized protein n=1 Tax=Monilinia fructigena TaxID=38457 RepID=A0A395ILG5_9HELO|nr:hypothetical protein DID88_010087 [Monilinia fructigena]
MSPPELKQLRCLPQLCKFAISKEEDASGDCVPQPLGHLVSLLYRGQISCFCFILMLYLVGPLTNLDGSPALRQIALIDAPPARVLSGVGTSTTDTPVFVPSNYVEAYKYTTASSVEVPASTEIAAVHKHDYLPQVFYSFKNAAT